MESLVALRAELQLKRQQQQEQQLLIAASTNRLKLKTGPTVAAAEAPAQNRGVSDRDVRDRELTEQEQQTEQKVKSVLEQKAALYDKLQAGVAVLENDSLNNSFLVNFQKKIVDDVLESKRKRAAHQAGGKKNNIEDTTTNEGNPNDLVEFVDCLGRSREVRRCELPELQQQDRFLAGEQGEEEEEEGCQSKLPSSSAGVAEVTIAEVTDQQELYEEQHRAQQRQRWQQKEEANAMKQDIHYDDVMFDEARSHGVGFVRLSGDSSTRREQQKLLQELHEASATAAASHRAQQRHKDKNMAQRLAKIRQRKRLKRGLPMLEEMDDKLKTPPPSDDEEEKQEVEEAAAVPVQRPAKKPGGQVREWDVGKQIVGKFVEPADKDPQAFSRRNLLGGPVDQEAWVDRQRRTRDQDFAPPSSYGQSKTTNHGKTAFAYGNKQQFPTSSRSLQEEEEDKSQRQYNDDNKNTTQFSGTIVNECSNSNRESSNRIIGKCYESSSVFIDYRSPDSYSKAKGAEIAPPSSFEYYGPPSKRGPHSKLFESERKMEEAINKGLKNLREQT